MKRNARATDLPGLEALALGQGGYFDRMDAHAYGIGDDLLGYHLRAGRFERLYPGIYRLRNAPIVADDDLLLAWVYSHYRGAISHESALSLYGLSDVMPSRVHLTVPPVFWRAASPFELHRAHLRADEMQVYHGVQVTTPARSIVDAASAGTGLEQIEKAVQQSLNRALASPEQIREAAARPRYRHRRTMQPLLEALVVDAEERNK